MLVGKLPVITGKTAWNWRRAVLSADAAGLLVKESAEQRFPSGPVYRESLLRMREKPMLILALCTGEGGDITERDQITD